MEGVVIREVPQHSDHRGWLAEIFRADETPFTPVMSYLSLTRPGLARGPHEHREQSDYFAFFGRFRLFLWDNRKDSPTFGERILFDTDGRPTIAIVPPGVVHAYKNIAETEGLVVNLPDRLYRGEGKREPVDEIRHEDDPETPFRVE